MSATAETPLVVKPPVLRITPPGGWWKLPLGELWAYRELLYFFVWRDIKIRYKQTVIGAAWAVLQPLLLMTVFTLFFGRLAHIPTDGLPYPIFYYSALLPWMYFAASLQNATNTIVENQRVITKVYFPRLDLPLSSVLSGLVDFGISFLMFAALMIYYRIHPTMAVVWLPAFLLLALLTAFGVGLWLSALNAMYRDVRYVIPFLVQFWMFASPLVYPTSRVPEKWRWVYGLNPMAGVIEGFRGCLLGGGPIDWALVASSWAVTLLLLVIGGLHFRSTERVFADIV
jgi:lipopolysaccharide transport system permease protein